MLDFADWRAIALAVVLDAEGLDTDAMQAIAGEFNLSETVFVLPPQDPAHRASLRIFNPVAELPFAGHPTVGTAVLLNRIDGGGMREIILEKGVGPIPCSTASLDDERGRPRFRLARLPEELGEAADAKAIAAALRIQPNEIGFDDFRPSLWSAGISFTLVPVRNLAIASRRPAIGRRRSRDTAAVRLLSTVVRLSKPAPRSTRACSRRTCASRRTGHRIGRCRLCRRPAPLCAAAGRRVRSRDRAGL